MAESINTHQMTALPVKSPHKMKKGLVSIYDVNKCQQHGGHYSHVAVNPVLTIQLIKTNFRKLH